MNNTDTIWEILGFIFSIPVLLGTYFLMKGFSKDNNQENKKL